MHLTYYAVMEFVRFFASLGALAVCLGYVIRKVTR